MSVNNPTLSAGAGAPDRRPSRIEWPTIGVALLVYGGWLAATWLHRDLAWPLRAAVGGWLIAWHGSLQHEVIHGHPTPWRRLNTLIGAAPLSLWLPFERYRRSHLAHHATEEITEPGPDPESRYLAPRPGWLGALARAAGRLQVTLAGRLLFGPFVEVGRFLWAEWTGILAGDAGGAWVWTRHALAAGVVLMWLKLACGMTVADYLLTFLYPGAALTLLRSFAEHRAAPLLGHRVAIVERAPVLGLLFLNNNLHAVHHADPGAPWHQLPGLYRRRRDEVLRANGGLVYSGYGEVIVRYLLRPHDDLIHPALSSAQPRGWRGAQ